MVRNIGKLHFCLLLCSLFASTLLAKQVDIVSPKGKLRAEIVIDQHVSVQIFNNGEKTFEIKDIYLDTDQGFIPKKKPSLRSVKKRRVDEIVRPEIKEKNRR